MGPATQAKLAEYGVETIGDLADLPKTTLGGRLGKGVARHLSALSWNRDPRGVTPMHSAKSVSSQSGFGRRKINHAFINKTLHDLADRVASRLRKKDRNCRTITVRIRFGDMSSITRSLTLAPRCRPRKRCTTHRSSWSPPASPIIQKHDEVSLLSVGASGLSFGTALQLELPLVFDDTSLRLGSELGRKHHDLDKAIDSVRDRFGRDALGHAASTLSKEGSGVAEEFRELAQKS